MNKQLWNQLMFGCVMGVITTPLLLLINIKNLDYLPFTWILLGVVGLYAHYKSEK
jgi:hypothetical protein